MKKVKWLGTLFAAGIAFAMVLSGCGSNSGESEGLQSSQGPQESKKGLVTFINIPQGYVVSYIEVNSNPTIGWTPGYSGNVSKPGDNTWYPTLIGYGSKQDFNTSSIQSVTYKSQNGVWVQQYNNTMPDFNYSGWASVYAQFQTPTDINHNTFGINNVQFSGGYATIDFTPLVIPKLSNDIDAALIGTWNEKILGASSFTITINSNDGITWGGSIGSPLQTTTDTLRSNGYTVAWVAKNNKITYISAYPGIAQQSVDVYGYRINDSGELELLASNSVFSTLVKQ